MCKSFFDPQRYDIRKEVLHTQTMAWGRPDSGRKLNEFKFNVYRAVLQLIEKHSPPPGMLLDAGCGYGGFLMEASKRGYKVMGLDILPQAVDYVRSLGIPAERCSSIGEVKSIEDGSLQVVTCLDCNYYWPDQPFELRCAFAKLKAGGYLAMRVADKSWMLALGLRIQKVAPRMATRILRRSVNDHRFSMPVRSLLRILQACGFHIVHASPCGAIHSKDSSWTVKLSFALGSLFWRMTGKFMAPGAVILARKPAA